MEASIPLRRAFYRDQVRTRAVLSAVLGAVPGRSSVLLLVLSNVAIVTDFLPRYVSQATDALVEQMGNNAPVLVVLAQSLTLLVKIYYDLNCQELPEFFEDNLEAFMNLLYKYLNYSNPLLVTEVSHTNLIGL